MTIKKNIWKTIEQQEELYNSLNLNEMKNYKKFYIYSIIAHSTAIEGSTLSERDAQLLFDEGITQKGNIVEYLMNIDLKTAYEFALTSANKKTKVTPALLKKMNAMIMKNTGGIYNMSSGTFDSIEGDYRLCGVTAGIDRKSYMNYTKIPENMNRLCEEINKRLDAAVNLEERCNLAFDAHFNLGTIHPWLDGNGRTSRLLMNYIQFYFNIAPTKIYKENKGEYINALEESRDKESNIPIREFMAGQHLKTLNEEINNFTKNKNSGNNFSLLF